MPYFYKKEGDEYCVYKGTSDDPKGQVKCHATEAEAKAHVAALMANVEDAKQTAGGVDECECPECGATAKHEAGTPCRETKCPKCGAEMVAKTEKATWTTAYVNSLPDSSFLYVEDGDKDDEGKTVPRSKRHLPYRDVGGSVDLPHLRNAISRLGQPKTGSGDGWLTESLRERLLKKARAELAKAGKKSWLTTYQEADGTHHWIAISSTSLRDREGEVVSEKAYDDAIALAEKKGYGELDLVHFHGTDVGDCEGMARLKNQLLEWGTWRDTPMADRARKAVEEDPDYWGISVAFYFDPEQFDVDSATYKGGIHIFKRTILPEEMAAAEGTAIAVTGGKMGAMTDEKALALKRLGVTDEEIVQLAGQATETPGNVKEKDQEQPALDEESFLDRVRGMLHLLGLGGKSETPEPEQAEKATEVDTQDTPAADETPEPPEFVLDDSVTKAIAGLVEDNLLGAIDKALEPVGTALSALYENQKSQGERIDLIQAHIAELQRPIEDRVIKTLEELPPVVKVAASQTLATSKVADEPTEIAAEEPQAQTYQQQLFAEITRSIEQAIGRMKPHYEV